MGAVAAKCDSKAAGWAIAMSLIPAFRSWARKRRRHLLNTGFETEVKLLTTGAAGLKGVSKNGIILIIYPSLRDYPATPWGGCCTCHENPPLAHEEMVYFCPSRIRVNRDGKNTPDWSLHLGV